MDWNVALLIFILPMSAMVHGQAVGEPVVLTQSGQKLHTTLGGIASISCRAENLGSRKMNWVFVKHGTTIFHGNTRMVNDPRYSVILPVDGGNIYRLQINGAKAHDQGVYKCEIDGTKLGATLELVVQGSASPEVDGSHTPLNRTGCCRQRNVSETCLPVCQPSTASASVDFATACATDLPNLVYCGSDGRNHENCCARSMVPQDCLLFCSNDQEKMSQVGYAELHCLNHTEAIISCYEFGGDLLPTPPQSVSVLQVSRNGSFFMVVSWRPPKFNPTAVTGYRVLYKKYTDAKFISSGVLHAATNQYSISVDVNSYYSVYVVAVAHHGSSQPSDRVTAVIADTTPPGHAKDVLTCCKERKVSSRCQTTLCHPRVWYTFNTTDMLACYVSLNDIFSCLAGQRNNTDCCSTHNVPDVCLGMCSGTPPPFNRSLAMCIPKLSIMEACVQQGLVFQPSAPVSVTVNRVGAHVAVVTWTAPNVTGTTIRAYYVQLRRGNANASWITVAEVAGTFYELTNLTETETYSVRVISQGSSASSLPSASVSFTTYPETTAPERPTVAHNLTKCCVDSGMPSVCAQGCQYVANMTAYYAAHLDVCMMHIGTVLTCAADGRDHTPCCRDRNVKEICYGLCAHNAPGPLDPRYLACIQDTALIVMCYKEGLENLVRMPEEVKVTNLTSHTITVEWKQPETGPKPEEYHVTYINLMTNTTVQKVTSGQIFILQDLTPASGYAINVTSYLNNSFSPPTQTVTVFTPAIDSDLPFVPSPPGESGRVLWNNRTHCCKSGNISTSCQPECLNQPNGTDCSAEAHNILTCAADGKDHGICCRENGLPSECLPLCSGHSATNFSVRLAGCLADANLDIITSCFLSYSGLLPSMPYAFTAQKEYGSKVRLQWRPAENCDPNNNPCTYNVHYWRAANKNLTSYTTVKSVTSPYDVTGLTTGVKYTFTVTAENSYGSGPAAPWQTLYFAALIPDVSIAQVPKLDIFEQGTMVQLVCDVFNFREAPSITWRLRQRVISTGGRVLRLGNVSRHMEGNYSCNATNSDFTAVAESYVNIRFKPEFNYFRTDTVNPNLGAEAVMACWFRGHPSTSNPAGVWTKDGRPIPQTSRHSTSTKSRFHTGITAFKLKIANVVRSDYGTYKCNVSNRYGSAVAITKLMELSAVPTPIQPTPLEKKNITACCKAKGVIDTCMPLCTFEVSLEEAVSDPGRYGVCLVFFDELIACAADGADHTLCCEKEVVDTLCLPFCKGEVPPVDDVFNSPHLLRCVAEAPKILDCMEKGYDKIPTAPHNLVASFIGNRIKIAWDKPSRNADRVTSYTINYNFTGNPKYQTETVTAVSGFNHVIDNADRDHIYHIWMTAESQGYGRSRPSQIISLSVFGTLPMPPKGVAVTKIDGTTVVIGWQALPPESVPQESFAIYYKPRNSVKYEKELTTEYSITLTGLKAKMEYTAYVSSRSRAGEGLPSKSVRFTTEEEGPTGRTTQTEARGPTGRTTQTEARGLGGGQVAGIVLAIVVVIAVSAVIVAFLIRSRHVWGHKMADTVAFENPGYGNQQVHIGSLPSSVPGDNPYDSVMQPQTQPETEGSYGYARLNENQAAAAAAAIAASNTAKPASEMDYPSTQYATPADPSGINVTVGSNGMHPLEGFNAAVKNESMT